MLTLNAPTLNEWISRESNCTATNRIMIDDLAACVRGARARTRVDTLLTNARAILVARSTDNALRSAVRCAANVARQAGANSVTVYRTALAVLSAWRRITWIDGFGLF